MVTRGYKNDIDQRKTQTKMSEQRTFTKQNMPPQLHGDDDDIPPRPTLEEYNGASNVQDLLPTVQHLLPAETTNMNNVVALTGRDNWSEFRVSFIGLYYDGPYSSLFDPNDTSKTDDFIYEMDAAADLYLSIMASISGDPLVWLSSRIDLFLCGHDSFFALQECYG